MEWLRDKMTISSRLRYLAWRIAGGKNPLTVRLSHGPKIVLRPEPATDLGVAMEIFVYEIYRLPRWFDPRNPQTVVDVGGNVGFSCLLWLNAFPNAHLTVFEPHPAHVAQIHANLSANCWTSRATVHACAAGPAKGLMHLVDDGCRSHAAAAGSTGTIVVPVEDWFGHCLGKSIDLLKIDIEGGEFALLEDIRFEKIDARIIVMEWHKLPDRPDAQAWCRSRLEQIGYTVEELPIHEDNGLIWARRGGGR